MTDSDSMTQVRQGQEANRGKGGKEKQSNKRSKAETPSRRPVEQAAPDRQPDSGVARQTPSRDPQLIARIQERAYVLFEAGGRKHGHALEHWLEAERQIIGSDQPDT